MTVDYDQDDQPPALHAPCWRCGARYAGNGMWLVTMATPPDCDHEAMPTSPTRDP